MAMKIRQRTEVTIVTHEIVRRLQKSEAVGIEMVDELVDEPLELNEEGNEHETEKSDA